MNVYLDNAATTPVDDAVLEAMLPYLKNVYGNPSSTHAAGREARSAIEQSRKKVADLLGVTPAEICFTSGGTEADNTAVNCTVEAFGVKHAITSPLEHHAVLHPLEHLEKQGRIKLHRLETDKTGSVNLQQLEELLAQHPGSLVSLMHGNNEIGNLNNLLQIGELCAAHEAYFHSDTVQTMGHYALNLKETPVHYAVASAHKFHGPKGTGFLYVRKNTALPPLLHGGSQERERRGGTENVAGIVGLAKAFELAYTDQHAHQQRILNLKKRMITGLQERIEGVEFNGNSMDLENSLYTVLNVSFPPGDNNGMLLFSLDLANVAASGGSACSSGAQQGSHVLNAIGHNPERGAVRFSFSRFNTEEEVDYVVNKLSEMYPVKAQ
jgi:cysteine desulfurase